MKKLIVVVLLLGININLFALSPKVENRMLQTKLTQQLEAKQYAGAVITISEIRTLRVEIPKSLDFLEGKALFESNRQAESYKKFESYADSNEESAEYYNQAIDYLVKADPYAKLKDRIIRDRDTGLLWQDDYAAKTVIKTWRDAKTYCSNLILADYSDWRLPNKDELESIVNKSNNPTIKGGFQNVASDDYWSSSVSVSDSSEAWDVGFYDGGTNSDTKSCKVYVRCVRGRQ